MARITRMSHPIWCNAPDNEAAIWAPGLCERGKRVTSGGVLPGGGRHPGFLAKCPLWRDVSAFVLVTSPIKTILPQAFFRGKMVPHLGQHRFRSPAGTA